MRKMLLGLLLAVLWPTGAWAQNPCTRVGQEICQQGQVYRCEQTASQITPIFQNRPCVVERSSLVGTWRGSGRQTPAGPGGADYPIVMTIGPNGASIDYPSLGCGGTLSLVSGSGTSAQYRESITYGGNKCITGGLVAVNLFRGRLSWTWSGSHQGQQYNVIAVLESK
jgi:hypothetical protein